MQSIAVSVFVCLSVCLFAFLCVCLSVRPLAYLKHYTSNFTNFFVLVIGGRGSVLP